MAHSTFDYSTFPVRLHFHSQRAEAAAGFVYLKKKHPSVDLLETFRPIFRNSPQKPGVAANAGLFLMENIMQASKESFEACRAGFMAIPETEVTYCKLPVEVGVSEATQLATAAAADASALTAWGLAAFFLVELPTRAAAYMYAAAMFLLVTDTDPDAVRLWKELWLSCIHSG